MKRIPESQPFYLHTIDGNNILVPRRDGFFALDIPPSKAVNWDEFVRVHAKEVTGLQILCRSGTFDAQLISAFDLQKLVLHGNARVRNSSILFNMPNLRSFLIEGSYVFDDLSEFHKCSLDSLGFSNQNSRPGLKLFHAAMQCSRLEELYLTRVNLPDFGSMAARADLKVFSVCHGSIGSSKGLGNLTSLKKLDVFGARLLLDIDITGLIQLQDLSITSIDSLQLLPENLEKLLVKNVHQPAAVNSLRRLNHLADFRAADCSNLLIEHIVMHPTLSFCCISDKYKKQVLEYSGLRNSEKKLTVFVGAEQFHLGGDGRFTPPIPSPKRGPSLIEIIEQNRKFAEERDQPCT